MSYITLPKRFFNSPLMAHCNFADGSNINLIRLLKPYANGIAYGVYETTKSPFCSNGMFKTLEKAQAKFELMCKNGNEQSPIVEKGYL